MGGITESFAERSVDFAIRKYKGTTIQYYPYASGVVDVYGQRDKTFGTPVTLVGRAILTPTPEQISMIGDNEKWDIAFFFSRLELVDKFPGVVEGEWLSNYGEMTWDNRRFKIEKVAPSGQVSEKFLLVIALGNTIEGRREP